MTQNLISHSMTTEKFDTIVGLVQQLREEMDFLIGLPEKQKSSLLRVGEKNINFALLMERLASKHTAMLPAAINLDEYRRDLRLYEQLREIREYLNPLLELLDDTQLAAGSDAYTNALTMYGIAKALNLEGMEEAQRKMSQRFAGIGKSKPVAAGGDAPAPSQETPNMEVETPEV